MSPDDLTPERLDAVLDGSEPATNDAERDMLALAASLRGVAPGASDDLHERVRAIARPAAARPAAGRRSPGWRTRFLIAGPAIATVVAAVVVIAVVGGDDPPANRTSLARESVKSRAFSSDTTAQSTTSADAVNAPQLAPAAPGSRLSAAPAVLRIAPGTLQQRIADARRIVVAADGAVTVSLPKSAEPSALLEITLPPDRASGALAQLARLGTGGDGAVTGPDGTVRLLLAEEPPPG